MPRGLDDAVRTYQLPTDAQSQLSLPPTGFTSNKPITITPGLGGSGSSNLPPIQTGSGSYSGTITYYVKQASVEQALGGDTIIARRRRSMGR